MPDHPFHGPMVLFDLETLAVLPDARVYEVGALRFRLDRASGEAEVLEEGHWFLHGRDQEGRRVDPATMSWMHGVPGRYEALDKALAEGIGVPELAQALEPFFRDGALGWCRGTHFDMSILDSLFRGAGVPSPWRYDQVLDLRTLGRFAEYLGVPGPEGEAPHDALEDCRRELPQLVAALGYARTST